MKNKKNVVHLPERQSHQQALRDTTGHGHGHWSRSRYMWLHHVSSIFLVRGPVSHRYYVLINHQKLRKKTDTKRWPERKEKRDELRAKRGNTVCSSMGWKCEEDPWESTWGCVETERQKKKCLFWILLVCFFRSRRTTLRPNMLVRRYNILKTWKHAVLYSRESLHVHQFVSVCALYHSISLRRHWIHAIHEWDCCVGQTDLRHTGAVCKHQHWRC